MKGLFVVFHGFSAHSGISKKIFSQCDALKIGTQDFAGKSGMHNFSFHVCHTH